MTTNATPTLRRVPLNRRVLVGLLIAAAVLMALLLAYRHFTNPQYIRQVAERGLSRHVRGTVTVAAAEFSFFEGIRLHDLTISETVRAPSPGGPDARVDAAPDAPRSDIETPLPVFQCRKVHLMHAPWSILFGRLNIEALLAVEPVLSIVHDQKTDTTNLRDLLTLEGRPFDRGEAATIPKIELRDARIRVVTREGARDRLVEDMRLTIRGRPSIDEPHLYDLVWNETRGRGFGGHSQLDLITGSIRNVRGGLPPMSIEAVMLAVSTGYDGAGALSGVLGIEGTIRARDYDLIGEGPEGRSVTIDLSNASISVPVDDSEVSLPRNQRYLRFDRVNGDLVVREEGITAAFEGQLHGSPCRVDGTLRGGVETLQSLDDVDLDVRFRVSHLSLPRYDEDAPAAHRRFIDHWDELRKSYLLWRPTLRADIDIAVSQRAGTDGMFELRSAEVVILDGEVLYQKLPYPLRELNGAVQFTPEGVSISGVRGRAGAGTFSMDGLIPSRIQGGPAVLQIQGHHVLLDDEAIAALPDSTRRIIEQFSARGPVSIVYQWTMPDPTGDPDAWHDEGTVSLEGVSARLDWLDVPLESLDGTVRWNDKEIVLSDVNGRAAGAALTIDGTVQLDKGRLGTATLDVKVRDLYLDDSLAAALPDWLGVFIEQLRPRGHIDLSSHVVLTPDKPTTHQTRVSLDNLTLTPAFLPATFTDVRGQVDIQDDRLIWNGLMARHGPAEVDFEGSIRVRDGGWSGRMLLRAENLELDDSLVSALPAAWKERVDPWRTRGPSWFEVLINRPVDDMPERVEETRMTARFLGATVQHPFFPIPFESVQGEIVFDHTGARALGLTGRYGAAEVQADFEIGSAGDGLQSAIGLTTRGLWMSDLREILPPDMRPGWDAFDPQGRVDLFLEDLRLRRSAPDQPSTWTLEGRAHLQDVSVRGPGRVERLSGILTGRGLLRDARGGVMLSGGLSGLSFQWNDRTVQNLEGLWSFTRTAGRRGRFSLDGVRAELYEGTLTANYEMMLEPQETTYALSAMIQDMQINPFLAAGKLTTRSGEPIEAYGLFDGTLDLSGVVGNDESRRGTGRLIMRQGRLVRVPFMLAILHVLNLSVPEGTSLDEAETSFFLVGNRVELKDIVLRGGALALVGYGTLSLPDFGVDVSLVSINPGRWPNWAFLTNLVESATREIVELRVTGPIHQPTVQTRPFRGITEELQRLFQRKQPRPVRSPGQ